jgi:Tfp pilus assembly protein PilV
MTQRKGKEAAGFSLLEMVFALGLLALGILATIQVAARVVRTNQLARDYAAGLSLAADKMEEIKSLGYGKVAGGYEPQAGARSPNGPNAFQRRITVTEQTSPRLKRVWIEVTWQAEGPRQAVLASIVTP